MGNSREEEKGSTENNTQVKNPEEKKRGKKNKCAIEAAKLFRGENKKMPPKRRKGGRETTGKLLTKTAGIPKRHSEHRERPAERGPRTNKGTRKEGGQGKKKQVLFALVVEEKGGGAKKTRCFGGN